MTAPSSRAILLEAETLHGLAGELTRRGASLAEAAAGVQRSLGVSGLPGYVGGARSAATDVAGISAQLVTWGAALRGRAALTEVAGRNDMPGLLLHVRRLESHDPRGAFRAFALQMASGAGSVAVERLTPQFLRFVAAHGVLGKTLRVELQQSLAWASRQIATDVMGAMAITSLASPWLALDDLVRRGAGLAARGVHVQGGAAFGAVLSAGIQVAADWDEDLETAERIGRVGVSAGAGVVAGMGCLALGLTTGLGGIACVVVAGTGTGIAAGEINRTVFASEAEEAAAEARDAFRRHTDNLAKLHLFYEEYGELSAGDRKAMLGGMHREEVYVRPSGDASMVVRVTYYRPDSSRFAVQEIDRATDEVLWTTFYEPDGRTTLP